MEEYPEWSDLEESPEWTDLEEISLDEETTIEPGDVCPNQFVTVYSMTFSQYMPDFDLYNRRLEGYFIQVNESGDIQLLLESGETEWIENPPELDGFLRIWKTV